jgi:transposase
MQPDIQTLNIGKKFRIYPTRGQLEILSRWLGEQRFIHSAKVMEDRYFQWFERRS